MRYFWKERTSSSESLVSENSPIPVLMPYMVSPAVIFSSTIFRQRSILVSAAGSISTFSPIPCHGNDFFYGKAFAVQNYRHGVLQYAWMKGALKHEYLIILKNSIPGKKLTPQGEMWSLGKSSGFGFHASIPLWVTLTRSSSASGGGSSRATVNRC